MSLLIPIIKAFNLADVKYVTVGGLAVLLHGHTRLTTDVDFVIELAPENIIKAVNALASLGYKPKVPVQAIDFADPIIRKSWIEEKNMKVFGFADFSNPLFSVDLFVEYPLDFSELYKNSLEKDLASEKIKICSLDHLIQMKEESGRAKDLEDVKILKRIRQDV